MFDNAEYRIGFGIGEDRHGRVIPAHTRVASIAAIEQAAAAAFGGFTIRPVRGGWVNPAGHLVTEQGEELTLLTDDGPGVEAFAQIVGRELNQHSVVVIRPGGAAAIVAIDYTDSRPRTGIPKAGEPLYTEPPGV